MMMRRLVLAWVAAACVLAAAAAARADVRDAVAADPPATGAFVLRAAPDGAAAAAGVRAGDVVTHYDGEAMADSKALTAAIRAKTQGAGDVELTYVRRGEGGPVTLRVPRGRLGVAAIGIERGKPQPLRPPATDVALDVEAYRAAPRDEWYAMRAADGKHFGFQHHRAEVKDERLTVTSEFGYQNDKGNHHLVVTMTTTAEPRPRLIESRHYGPTTEGFLYTMTADPTGRRLAVRIEQPGQKQDKTVELPEGAVFEYLALQLPALMPMRAGACLHYDLISESGDVTDPGALLVGEPGRVEVDGRQVEAVPVTMHRLGHKLQTTWVEPATRTVVKVERADGATQVRTTKAAATAGLDARLKPAT